MIQLTITKNSGDSHSVVTTAPAYAAIQGALAESVAKHISDNPTDQEIEEVVIRWKAPVGREYSYRVERKA